MKTKRYVDEILRICKILTTMKYDADEDKLYKKLIADNLNSISKIERVAEEEKELLKNQKILEKFKRYK